MEIILNKDQARGLSNFFFDVAKSLALVGIGSIGISGLWIKIAFAIASYVCMYACIITALEILKENK